MANENENQGFYKAKNRILDFITESWTRSDDLRLHCGEMTAQELRTVKAVVQGIVSTIQSMEP